MASKFVIPLLSAALLGPVALASSGGFERQHAPHVHGHATGSLAQDGARFALSLRLPGINLAGFEHAPRDDDQQEILDQVMAALKTGAWLSFDPNGECRIDRIELAAPGFGLDASADEPAHAHDGQDHDHDHDHAEFHLEAIFNCEQADGLAWLAVDLFTDYPGNEQMRIDVLTERRVERVRLRPGNDRIALHATR